MDVIRRTERRIVGGSNNVIGRNKCGRMHNVGVRVRIGHQAGTGLLRSHTNRTRLCSQRREIKVEETKMANPRKQSVSLAELISSCCSCVTPKTKRKYKESSSREEEHWEGRYQHF